MGSVVLTELETIDVETGSAPKAAVIWLHGLGADAHDFEPVVPVLPPAILGALAIILEVLRQVQRYMP